ncbi:MAG: hypothetical protein AVDCRST_MAG73-2779 [uncultured Thermomicrobiales bacterium]|uniref:TolB protein, periplasmic protein involved in the tonb-independent uptake of group A colicins n=1 Tax=uncultured Thermomicrobiales bacterium TaxID=1645740 RepID=A0A6J4UK68_9BACT|nr:MAG: hypothetical protein AVDCRST_MAG73-2779 [uncultured Thermomicrobiales bacterium]
MSLLVTVAGCADDDTDRRFANDPVPTAALATQGGATGRTAVAPPSVTKIGVALPRVSPVATPAAIPAPGRIYVRSGAAVWAVSGDGSGANPVYAGEWGVPRIVAASLDGERVAVLLTARSGETETSDLIVLDASGRVIRRWDGVEGLLDAAEGARPEARSLAWNRGGTRLLAAFGGGGLLVLPLEGDPSPLVPGAVAPDPSDAAWSPAGNAIAYVDGASSGDGVLYVASVEGVAPDPVAIAPLNGGGAVERAGWLPAGSGILIAQRGPGGGPGGGVDLFRVSAGGGGRQLVASAGVAGPVARVSRFAPSPDGLSVAYAVELPGENGGVFHSLRLASLGPGGETGTPLPLPPGTIPTGFWWSSAGLIVQTEGGALVRFDGTGQATQLPALPALPATPVASPMGSPVGTPVASPVGSPGAGSPAAEGGTPSPEPVVPSN